MSRKLVVFCRAYNDVDHITPILYAWRRRTDIPATLILTDRGLAGDFRIRFLRDAGIEIATVDEVAGLAAAEVLTRPPMPARLKRLVRDLIPPGLVRRFRRVRGHAASQGAVSDGHRRSARRLLDALGGDGHALVVAFDWTYTPLARAVTGEARRRGHVTVSLPHGDRPYVNRLFADSMLNYAPRVADPAYYDLYDHVVVPNRLTAAQDPHWDQERLRVLGSPRFNREWQSVLDNLVEPYENDRAAGCLKLVVFLRDPGYPVFLRELVTSIRMLQQFDPVHVILKHHTRKPPRGGDFDVLMEMAEFRNVEFVGAEVQSSALIDWADLVLDLGTTICFEAVQKAVPVLSMEYMHSNRSTLAHYLPTTAMRCRDDFYDTIRAIRYGGLDGFYREEDRDRFINEMIEYPDACVLERHVRFLEGCFPPVAEAAAAAARSR